MSASMLSITRASAKVPSPSAFSYQSSFEPTSSVEIVTRRSKSSSLSTSATTSNSRKELELDFGWSTIDDLPQRLTLHRKNRRAKRSFDGGAAVAEFSACEATIKSIVPSAFRSATSTSCRTSSLENTIRLGSLKPPQAIEVLVPSNRVCSTAKQLRCRCHCPRLCL